MQLTKKRKIMAVVLGAAVGVFLVDRVLLGYGPAGPEQAQASSAFDLQGVASILQGFHPEDEPELNPQEEVMLSDRLEGLADDRAFDPLAVRDAFRPGDAWGGFGPAEGAPTISGEASAFADQYKLTATAVSGQGGMAIVNGQCLVVGQSLDGFRLVSVGRESADLVSGELRVRLHLSKGASASGE